MYSWRKAELKAPVCFTQAGKIDPKERALQKVVKAPRLTRKFFIFVFEERRKRKINSGNAYKRVNHGGAMEQ